MILKKPTYDVPPDAVLDTAALLLGIFFPGARVPLLVLQGLKLPYCCSMPKVQAL